MRELTDFDKNFALTWAHAHLAEYLRTHPDSNAEERKKVFLDAFEGGLSIALESFDAR